MRSAGAVYLAGAAAAAAGRAAAAAAGVASLWLLTRLLPKEEFGAYAFAMAAVALAALVGAFGLDRALLLRIARRAPKARVLRGRVLALKALLVALVGGGAVAWALAAVAPAVAAAGAAGAERWLPALAPAVPLTAASAVAAVWFQANHRATLSIAAPAVADVARCLLLGLAFLWGLGAAGVAFSAVAAAGAPLLVLGALAAARGSVAAPGRLGGADLVAGAQFLWLQLSTQSARHVDLLLLGLLASGAAAAEYVIAVRLAEVCDYGRSALKPSFAPRARRMIATGDRAGAAREFDAARLGGLAAALAGAAGFAALGGPVLGLFGDYGDARPALLLLAAGHVVNVGFGMHQTWLAMSGELGWSTVLRIAALGLLVGLLLLLAPAHGAAGAAAAVLITAAALNVFGAALAWRLTGLVSVDLTRLAVVAGAVGALAAAAAGIAGPLEAAAALAACLAATLALGRAHLTGALRVLGPRNGRARGAGGRP